MKRLAFAGLLFLAFDSVAFATPPAFNWTGFYIGGNVSYGWGDRDVDFSANDPITTQLFNTFGGKPPPISFDSTGAIGGIQLGYNRQFMPKLLVGIEVDFDWSNLNGSGSAGRSFTPGITIDETVNETIKWFGTTRVRAICRRIGSWSMQRAGWPMGGLSIAELTAMLPRLHLLVARPANPVTAATLAQLASTGRRAALK
jgi:opacity protein-like surface antigen